MKHHPANIQRAQYSVEALRAFAKETYYESNLDKMHPDDLETCIQDLITDLLHYYDQLPKRRKRKQAPSVKELHERALGCYYEELLEPEL